MFKGYIYRHWIINDKGEEKSYIGQVYRLNGKANPQRRWGLNGKGYAPEKGKEPTKFYNAIKKYGWDHFNHKVLFEVECGTEEELIFWLDEWEKYYIEKYDSFYNGYNSTTGGSKGIMSEETRRRMSKAQKGKPLSEEHKQKLSESHKGQKRSEETKRKMSKAQKGKQHSEETKQKLSESHKGKPSPMKGKPGKPLSEETKQKISEAMKGEKNPNYGKPFSEEHKQKLSEAKKGKPLSEEHKQKLSEAKTKKVICLETLQIFDTIKQASEWCHGSVSKNLNGNTKSAGKHPVTGERLHWMYLDEYEILIKEEELKN